MFELSMDLSHSDKKENILPFNLGDSYEICPSNVNSFERRLAFSMDHSKEIHSGHYMVSNIDDSESETEEAVLCLDDTSRDAMETSSSKDKNWLEFEDLASLFRYLEIAYTGQLTSPKWNQFRGLRFAVKNKIRLNNIIWREYHMQFVKKVRPYIVQFQAPLTENHSKPEAIVMEGKYWKRRQSTVCQEYRSWRLFAKNKILGPNQKHILACLDDLLGPPNYSFQKAQDELSGSVTFGDNEDCTFSPSTLLNDIMMDFDENLDLFFEQPLTFPNPKDLALLGIGDIMQPGLLQFEPNSTSPTEAMSSTGGQSKLGKRGPQEVRVAQDSVSSSIQREPLSVCSMTSNQPKKFVQSSSIGSNIAMHGPISDGGKIDFLKQHTSIQLINTQSTKISSTQPSYDSVAPTFEAVPGVVQDTGNDCAPTASISSHMKLDGNLNRTLAIKHSIGQPHTSMSRRSHTVKHFPSPALHKHRYSIPNAAHSNDKALKHIFRNGYLDSTSTDHEHVEGTNSPALLNALLHGPEVQKKPIVTPTFENISHQPGNVRNNSSIPLICSPLPSHTRNPMAPPVPTRQTDFMQVNPVGKSQRSVSLAPTSLITDSSQPQEELRNLPADCIPGGFKLDANDRTAFPTGTLPNGQETYPNSILKSTLTAPHPPLSNTARIPAVPHLQRTSTSDHIPKGTFYKACTYGSEAPSTNSVPYAVISDQSVGRTPADPRKTNSLQPLFEINNTKTVEPHALRHQCDLKSVSFAVDTHSNNSLRVANPPNLEDRLGAMPPGFSQPQFPLYPTLSTACEADRQRTSSASQNFNPSTAITLSTTQPLWSEAPSSSRSFTMDSQYWSNVAVKDQPQSNFFLPVNAPEQTMGRNKEETEGVNFSITATNVNPSLSSRGRSSSAGNLFPLPQPPHNYMAKPSSSTTMSSYGSTEVLSPPVSTQSNFICTSSPSCSPPPPNVFDSELSSRSTTAGNSSEEIRRRASRAAFQTLRRLIQMYSNLDGPAGGSRLAARRMMDLHDYRSSTTSGRVLGDIDDDIMSTWARPKVSSGGDGTGTDPYAVGTSESGTSGKATKAATLNQAAHLIRNMIAKKNALDVQLSTLRNEQETLKNAINTCCGKMTPSGSSSSRPVCDPYFQDRSEEWFRQYVQKRTEQCWKFYVFGLILCELFPSYCATVNTSSREHFVRSLFGWLDQHGSLGDFRLVAPRAMCRLSTTTSILRDPSLLPEQAKRAVAEMKTISLDSPVHMNVDPNEKHTFDAYNTGKITT